MPTEMNLAEIIAEVRRQDANFQTVILKTGHALRLVVVAEAAVEAKRLIACGMPDAAEDVLERALASPAPGAGEEKP